MAQDLTLNIKTTSDVPQAMDKAKSATVSFSKQVEDIQKKFSTSFKDIFLGFTAPMVILQGAISAITASIEKSKQDAKEGLDLLAKGETIYATSEEKKMAAFLKAKKMREDEQAQAKEGKEEIARQFLKTDEGWKIGKQVQKETSDIFGNPTVPMSKMPENSVFQQRALEAFLNSPEGKAYKPIFEDEKDKKAGTFKGPEGFSNVVGVGANPVIEKMTRQNEIMEEIKIILQEQFILNRNGSVPAPFTERVPLTMQKAGLS